MNKSKKGKKEEVKVTEKANNETKERCNLFPSHPNFVQSATRVV
jgi:hypothetical protein